MSFRPELDCLGAECPRDGDCPEHGRDRPGQCVSVSVGALSPLERQMLESDLVGQKALRRIEELEVELRGERGPDVAIYWRGSAQDFATDLAAVLTVEELAEMTGEVALVWREKATGRKYG